MSESELKEELTISRQETSEARLMNEALISSIGEALIIVNEYGIITQVNQHTLKLLGYTRKEMVGAWLPRVVPSVDDQGNRVATADRPILKALLSGRPYVNVVNYVRKDGSIIPVTGTASPFMVKDKPVGAVIIFRDYTREKQIERAKDEFVSLASHQLRTPLTAIRLFAELLQQSDNGNLTQRQKDYMNKIVLSTTRMIDLVSDFLNISRLELGELKIQNQPTDLCDLINEQVEELRPVAEANSIKLEFKGPSNENRTLGTDPNLLAQVIHNLITNAIRYTRPGEGEVKIKLQKLSSKYKITVADNGIGIPPEVEGRIFERFFRAENARRVNGDGSGLGLYLAKSIIEALGGKINCKSQVDEGTIFTLELPIEN